LRIWHTGIPQISDSSVLRVMNLWLIRRRNVEWSGAEGNDLSPSQQNRFRDFATIGACKCMMIYCQGKKRKTPIDEVLPKGSTGSLKCAFIVTNHLTL